MDTRGLTILKEFDSDDDEDGLLDSDEDSDAGEKCIILLSSLLSSSCDLQLDHLCESVGIQPLQLETTTSSAIASAVGFDEDFEEAIRILPTIEQVNTTFFQMDRFGPPTGSGGTPEVLSTNLGPSSCRPSDVSANADIAADGQPSEAGDDEQQHSGMTAVRGEPLTTASRAAALRGGASVVLEGGVRVRARPQIPPKPQIDAVRYSMANVQESCDWELDTLLNELSALETQLNSSAGGDQLLLGLPALPVAPSSKNPSTNTTQRNSTVISAASIAQHPNFESNKRVAAAVHSEDFMRTAASSSDCPSPDRDSAFGDSSSTESRNRCRNSAVSSSDSCRGSMNTPSPTQQASPNQSSSASSSSSSGNSSSETHEAKTASELKAAKIREALEKMREADIKKLYVKFFLDDGTSTTSMLVDERWTIAQVMRHIADKLNIHLTQHHAIVEEYPELFIKRIYEDHEYLVENIMMWALNSQNKLYFTRRADKYSFLERPEEFLLSERNVDIIASSTPSTDSRRMIIKDFFETDNVLPPELEGWMLLKADGKKSWKRHFFVLRPSGLYYCPKGKGRSSKDLQCLMNMQTNQVYTCTEWKRKYKSPTNFGFAIKHPKIQVKASKYIKYVCAEDALTFHKWMAALRIAKNGRQLYDNFEEATKRLECSSTSQPVKVDIPVVSPADCHRMSMIEVRKTSRQQEPPCLLNLSREVNSPAAISRGSSISAGNNNEPCSTSQNSIVFDQCDDLMTGTIKRAPCDLMAHCLRQCSQKEQCSPAGKCASPAGGAPDADSDSDEERFPPPPPTVFAPLSNPHTPNEHMQRSVAEPHRTACPTVQNGHSAVSPFAVPANGCVGAPTKHSAAPTPPAKPNLLANGKVCMVAPNSERLTSPQGATPPMKKVPPPPPPKRADTTRLHSATVDALHSELELAMARRLQRIEQH